MKGKVRFAVAAFMLTIFVAVFAGEALAASYPNWIGVKYVKAELVIDNNTNIADKNHLYVRFWYDIKNNSRDSRIMTAYYDQKLNLSGANFTVKQWRRDSSKPAEGWPAQYPWASATFKLGYKKNWTHVEKVELYPGQTEKSHYTIPLSHLINPGQRSWKDTNEAVKRGFSVSSVPGGSLDFQVSSKK